MLWCCKIDLRCNDEVAVESKWSSRVRNIFFCVPLTDSAVTGERIGRSKKRMSMGVAIKRSGFLAM
jgi:hypothetical protein